MRARNLEISVRETNPTIRRERPNLRFVVSYWESGRKKHRFFEQKGAASSWAAFKNAELKRYGFTSTEFPERLRVIARDAVEKMRALLPKPEPDDDTDDQMTDACKMVEKAVDEYVERWKASKKSCTAAELVKRLLAAKKADGATESHLRGISYRLKVFVEHFDGRTVSTITTNEIDEWLRSLPHGKQTRKHYRQLAVLAFNFAMRDGYALTNPAANTIKVKVPYREPGILTVDEAARLLEAATPNVLPYIAIGLFGGLRRAEIERLDWSEIDFDEGHIEIKAAKSKTAKRRFVTIQPNLREWLLPVRQHKGSVVPENCFRQSFDQACFNAGIFKWPHNALRHSFASYHLARFRNAADTSLQLGHLDSGVTFVHYRELVKPKDAEQYWNLRPSVSASEKVVPLIAPR